MTEDIYIVAGGTCEVNLDVEGEYMLSCVSITGRLAITIMDTTDYVKYKTSSTSSTVTSKNMVLTVNSTITSTLIPLLTRSVCEKKDDGLLYYKFDITDCSDRLKYILGIKSLPTTADDVFQTSPSLNGPTFFQVVCDKLSGCGTVTANSYSVNNMFQLSGPSYIGDMSKVIFSIRGVYDEDIEFNEDLLWHFQLTKLPPSKPGEKSSYQNTNIRIMRQYRK